MAPVNPGLAAVQSLLAAQGLRPPFNLPSAVNNVRNQANSVNEPPSRDSNSSAEDSGQFSPGETQKKMDFAHFASKSLPLQGHPNSNSTPNPNPAQIHAAQAAAKMGLGSMLDMNMNMKSAGGIHPTGGIPNLPGPLGEAMKFLQQRMAAVPETWSWQTSTFPFP